MILIYKQNLFDFLAFLVAIPQTNQVIPTECIDTQKAKKPIPGAAINILQR